MVFHMFRAKVEPNRLYTVLTPNFGIKNGYTKLFSSYAPRQSGAKPSINCLGSQFQCQKWLYKMVVVPRQSGAKFLMFLGSQFLICFPVLCCTIV